MTAASEVSFLFRRVSELLALNFRLIRENVRRKPSGKGPRRSDAIDSLRLLSPSPQPESGRVAFPRSEEFLKVPRGIPRVERSLKRFP